MVELFEQQIRTADRQSSKGNQLKWNDGDLWYKADYAGYEGLAEYVVSRLLSYSSLAPDEFVVYHQEQIQYKHTIYNGVVSQNFLKDDWQIITLERLFKNKYNKSFYESVWKIRDVEERCKFICNQVYQITGLKDFAAYFNKLMTIDAFFLNEDRHLHNIAVLMNGKGQFDYCRIFDHGACLLSDTTMDYPLGVDPMELISECHGKTISRSFDEQLDVSECLSKSLLTFRFDRHIVRNIVDECQFYSEEIKERVYQVICSQMAKYRYLFK